MFVNDNARSFLQGQSSHFHVPVFQPFIETALKAFLADSPYIDDIEHITRCFDKTTKPRFRNASEPQYVRFGSVRDNDASVNIRSGQLKLQGSVKFSYQYYISNDFELCTAPMLRYSSSQLLIVSSKLYKSSVTQRIRLFL